MLQMVLLSLLGATAAEAAAVAAASLAAVNLVVAGEISGSQKSVDRLGVLCF